MAPVNMINIENVTKVYGDKVILQNVSLGINEGDKIGIIGVNGCGKSSLLKLIEGQEEPDAGQIIRNRQASMSYLAQNERFEAEDTALSYVMRGKTSSRKEWNLEAEARTILKKLEVEDENAPVAPMSGGEKKRIALAKTLLAPSKVLILDEPTNHLDSSMILWLEEYLKRYTGILIMVTHDRYFLDRVTNRIVELDRGSLYTYDANYSGFLELRQQRIDSAAAGYRKTMSILRTELEWVRRGAKARSTKQKARLERFHEMEQVRPVEQDRQVEMDSMASRMGKKTIEIEHVSKAYEGRELIHDFTYYTLRNDRVGIVGKNGCGKTTLLRLLMGQELPDQGHITIGETIRIGYFSQMVENLNPEQRVIDAVKEVGEYIQTVRGMTSASQMCERFLFTPEVQYTPIAKLSGGERRRLSLLKVLMSAPNVLILDEPTNDLDIATLTVLEDYLDHFDGIVLAVSHDRYFLDRIVTRILAFEEGGCIRQYDEDYTTYLEKTGPQQEEKKPVKQTAKDSRTTWKKREEKLRFTYLEQKEYETIEEEIEKLEDTLAQIETEMEQVADQYERLQELTKQQETVSGQLAYKMERWEYLSELEEKISSQKM